MQTPSPLIAARTEAQALLVALDIVSPDEIDLELIAAYYNVMVRRRALSNCEGHMIRRGRSGVVVIADRAFESWKWRFVLAHELGHFLLHEELDQFFLMTECTSEAHAMWYRTSGHEAQANAFASELLMPAMFLAPVIAPLNAALDQDSGLARHQRDRLALSGLLDERRVGCVAPYASRHGDRVSPRRSDRLASRHARLRAQAAPPFASRGSLLSY